MMDVATRNLATLDLGKVYMLHHVNKARYFELLPSTFEVIITCFG